MSPQDNYDNLIARGFRAPFRIDLGCGKAALQPDVVGIGLNKQADPSAHIFCDLEKGIPLPDECAIFVSSNQLLEHIHNIIHLLNEIHRILIPGGKTWHAVPHYLGAHSWSDPTHVRAFTPMSFRYYSVNADGTPFVDNFSDYNITARFTIDKQEDVGGQEIRVWMTKV